MLAKINNIDFYMLFFIICAKMGFNVQWYCELCWVWVVFNSLIFAQKQWRSDRHSKSAGKCKEMRVLKKIDNLRFLAILLSFCFLCSISLNKKPLCIARQIG